jgi:hypothetical protein
MFKIIRCFFLGHEYVCTKEHSSHDIGVDEYTCQRCAKRDFRVR